MIHFFLNLSIKFLYKSARLTGTYRVLNKGITLTIMMMILFSLDIFLLIYRIMLNIVIINYNIYVISLGVPLIGGLAAIYTAVKGKKLVIQRSFKGVMSLKYSVERFLAVFAGLVVFFVVCLFIG